jgi:uncharacterized protein (DUF433 family)
MANSTLRDTDRIVQDPVIMVGKPVVRGTRIPVELVLGKFAADLDLDELFAAHPELTVEDVKAVLLYARKVVEADYRRSRQRADALAAAKA